MDPNDDMVYGWSPDLPPIYPLLVGTAMKRSEVYRIAALEQEDRKRTRSALKAWKPIERLLDGNRGLTEWTYRTLQVLLLQPDLDLEMVRKDTDHSYHVVGLEIQMRDAALKYGP